MDFEYFFSLLFITTLYFVVWQFVLGGLLSLFSYTRHEDSRIKIDFRR